jgi:hypothetical protein
MEFMTAATGGLVTYQRLYWIQQQQEEEEEEEDQQLRKAFS